MYKGSHFSTSSQTLIFCFLDGNRPNGYEIVSHYSFNLHFSNNIEQPFVSMLAICISSLEKYPSHFESAGI